MFVFRSNAWNVDHLAPHGVAPDDAEFLVEHARKPYPADVGDERYRVRGKSLAGRYLQVVFIFSPDDVVYVIHARPLTDREIRQFRRIQR